jgi:cyclic pyranopterin phosphate synthase
MRRNGHAQGISAGNDHVETTRHSPLTTDHCPYNRSMPNDPISHLDATGRARMVDVGDKSETSRWAVARARVEMSAATLATAKAGDLRKGDLRSVAELAGVMAAKRTSELIPLTHPLALDDIQVHVTLTDNPPGADIEATVRATGKTGVEMEALTAVAVASLTVYDMVKGLERGVRITDVRLVEKHGGRSGDIVLES